MNKFLKNFALGLLYFFLLPLELLAIVVFGCYGLGIYVVGFIKGTIRFFKGKRFFEPFPEDEKLLEIRAAQVDLLAHPNGVPATTPAPSAPAGPSTVYVQQNYYTGNPGAANQPASTPTVNPTPLPNNAPIDTTGFFRPSAEIPVPNATPIDMTAQQTPGIPIHHVNGENEPQQLTPEAKHETKNVAIIDLSKLDDGKDDQ
jgi:hypothetical protein